jgi:hypothetical protein
MRLRWKKPLFVFHRWAGIVLCAFFALWFLSGMFMMYVEFPQLTLPERAAGLRTLDFSTARLSPDEAAGRLEAGDFAVAGAPDGNRPLVVGDPRQPVGEFSKVSLGMLLDRPVYRFYVKGAAQPRTVFADTGELLQPLGAALGAAVARDFVTHAGWLADARNSGMRFAGEIQTDQWSVNSNLNPYRPLLKYALDDPRQTELYVASTTGEVVRDSDRRERLLGYPGAVTHWLYPTIIRRHADAWAWMVDILSGAGVVLAFSGLWIGLLRWRRRPSPGKRAVPYRGLMRWHYFTGAIFGLFVLTWVFSGLLSMNPAKINPSRGPSRSEALALAGKNLTPADFQLPPGGDFGAATVSAELGHYRGRPFYVLTTRDAKVAVRASRSADETSGPSTTDLIALAPHLMPGVRIEALDVLDRYDDYYYTRHPERSEKPLPVVRAQFADTDRTWFYMDPRTGQVLERSTSGNRLYRWLYNGLHSWDFPWLWAHRPLWDIAVLTFSLGGLLLSILGVVVGWRRLRMSVSGPAVMSEWRSVSGGGTVASGVANDS